MEGKRGKWSAIELLELRDRYGLVDDRRLARDLGRSVASVRAHAEKLFSGLPQRRGRWSRDERLRLKLAIGVYPLAWIAMVLRRSPEEVSGRIQALAKRQRVGPWSGDEVRMLKRLHGSRQDADLAVVLQRNPSDIRGKAKELCLRKDKTFARRGGEPRTTRMPRWGAADLGLLRALYPDHPNLDIAQRLGRSVKSVVNKARDLGLRKSVRRLRVMGLSNVAQRRHRRPGGKGS